jgi:protein-S-isoprenylcysteine O-methyltransferase Ste14
MELDTLFRLMSIALVLSLLVVWVYFQRRAGAYRSGLRQHGRMQREHEVGRLLILRPLLGFAWYVGLLAWWFAPHLIAWADVSLPIWLRAFGAVLGVLALVLLGLSMRALGRNFVATLGVQSDCTLITHGPYRWIRHPMYMALLLFQASIALLAANWFIGLMGVGLIIIVIAACDRRRSQVDRAVRRAVSSLRATYGASCSALEVAHRTGTLNRI